MEIHFLVESCPFCEGALELASSGHGALRWRCFVVKGFKIKVIIGRVQTDGLFYIYHLHLLQLI
jgi:hypothetical protein